MIKLYSDDEIYMFYAKDIISVNYYKNYFNEFNIDIKLVDNEDISFSFEDKQECLKIIQIIEKKMLNFKEKEYEK